MRKQLQRSAIAVAALTALVAVVGAGAQSSRGPSLTLHWQSPTPRDGAAFTIPAGEPFTLELAAASSAAHIGARPLPGGVAVGAVSGEPSRATVTWTPTAAQVGEHVLTFTAGTRAGSEADARPRSFFVYVTPSTPAKPDEPFALNGPRGMSRWAHVLTKIPARSRPSASARIVTRLEPITPEQTQNVVLALE